MTSASKPTPATAHVDPDPSKGWFRRLLPVIRARRATFIMVLVTGLSGLALQVSVPMVLRQAVDVAVDQRAGGLEGHVLLLVVMAAASFGTSMVLGVSPLISSGERLLTTVAMPPRRGSPGVISIRPRAFSSRSDLPMVLRETNETLAHSW